METMEHIGRAFEWAGVTIIVLGAVVTCWVTAATESFFATLKKELIHDRSWPAKAELRTEVFEYIEVFFNRRRRHSTLSRAVREQSPTTD